MQATASHGSRWRPTTQSVGIIAFIAAFVGFGVVVAVVIVVENATQAHTHTRTRMLFIHAHIAVMKQLKMLET
jgi:hypothetical protein